jgi:hypothetical protein
MTIYKARLIKAPLLIAVLSATAMSSQGGVISIASSFGFTDLDTSYDAGSGLYIAQSTTITSGDVTRFDPSPILTAAFGAGEINDSNAAHIEFRMNIDNATGSNADGINGQLLIQDLDGDNIAGSFSGTWDFIGGFGFFDGLIDFASYNSDGNGIFEGTGSGSEFDNPLGDFNGAISFLIQMPEWFDTTNGFEARSSQGDGILLTPTPGSVSLLALGGLFATRRRRSE